MYDITAHKITPVTNSGNATDPAIYGKRIVYTLNRPTSFGIGDIYTYNMSTAKTTRITTSNSAFSPFIYEDKLYMQIVKIQSLVMKETFIYMTSRQQYKICL